MPVGNISYSVPASILISDASIKLHSFVSMIFFSTLKCTSACDMSVDNIISMRILKTSMCIVMGVRVGLVTDEGDEIYCLC